MSIENYIDVGESVHSKIVALPQSQPDLVCGDYNVFTVSNVRKIYIESLNQHGWTVEYSENGSLKPIEYYFYFDCEQCDAFGHWIFESAYYLPLFKELKLQYPHLKLLSYKKKNFMISIYKAFEISEGDCVNDILSNSNKVFFPEFSTLAIHHTRELYAKHITRFYNEITNNMTLTKSIPVLYLPRGTAENFVPNDRKIPCQEELIELLPACIPNSQIYFTDKTKNIKDQINLIRSAQVLVVDYGSNLMFNGYFTEKTKVVVIGNIHRHVENPRPFDLIQDSERRNVTYYYLPGSVRAQEVLQVVSYLLTQDPPSYPHELKCWRQCEYCLSDV